MFTVVFVCTGNTCRSPMAEVIARREWGGNRSEIQVSSAGLAAAGGQPASNHALFVVHDRGGDLGRHRSRRVDDALVEAADLLVTMTRSHRDELHRRYPRRRGDIVTLAEIAGADERVDVSDPFGGDLRRYEDTYEQIERYVKAASPHVRARAHRRSPPND